MTNRLLVTIKEPTGFSDRPAMITQGELIQFLHDGHQRTVIAVVKVGRRFKVVPIHLIEEFAE